MRNLTFTRFRGVQSPSSWHQKFLGALLMLCMCVGFTTDTYAQVTLSADVENVSCNPLPCPIDSDGSIDLTITGGVEPYDIQWSFNGVDLPTCEEPAFDELNGVGSLDLGGVDNTVVEDAIATRNYIIQGSTLTVNDASFSGGATIDEEIINNSQETSIIGLRTGVDHDQIIGGPNAANMTRTFTFDPPVSNLRMFFNDLDNNDVVIVNPKLDGVVQTLTPAEYTIIDPTQVELSQVDARGNTDPNMFTSLVDQQLGPTTTGGIDFVFAGPIDEIEIIFYDDVAGPGVASSEGGSYTVNFPGQCREDLACIEAGTYTVVVTDANGASATETYVVTAPADCTLDLSAVITDVSCDPLPCPPDADGAIDLTINGGVEPFDIQWSFNGVELPTCEEPAFDELNGIGSLDLLGVDNTVVEDAIATRNYIIQGSAMTVNDASFNGGSSIDEEIINNSQEPSIIGLRTGVDHDQIIGGPNAANMIRTFTFDPPVSNLRMFFNDLDNNDVAIINPKLNGVTQTLTTSEYSIVNTAQVSRAITDARGNTSPNLFASDIDQGLNATTAGGIDFTFAGPVDEIEIIFYDDVAGPGVVGSEGGSYTVSFPGQCREDLACVEAGTYTVVVTDAVGASAAATYVVDPAVGCNPPTQVTIPCGADEGTITVSPSFGVAPYTFGWEDAAGNPLPLPDPCTDRDWASFEPLNGTGANPVPGGVDNSIVENAINTQPFVIQGAVMTVNNVVFNGGASIDEEIINDTQLNGTFALRTGVDHDQISGGIGGANMIRTITFSKPVCDLNMFFNDIDNNDVAIINPKLNGATIPLTAADFTLTGTNVAFVGGNQFESINDIGLNNTTDGGIDFTFTSCIDEIEIIFYDDVAGPGVVGSEGGSYSINFPPACDYGPTETLPPGCYNVTVFDANGDSQVITYCIEQDNCGAIGNLVWIDENADGIQDAGEPGIAGVTVILTNAASGEVFTTVTDADGGYLFDGLEGGNKKYDVLVDASTLPSGMTQTTNPTLPGADFGNQTQAGAGYSITLGDGEENLTGDFGYIWEDPNGNQGTAAIGDYVWYDANSDGVQDPGEAGIGGVTVSVLYDPDGDGIKDTPFTGAIDQNGNTGTGTTVTEPDGSYIFYNLPAGAYAIVVDPNSAPLAGLTQTGDPDDYGTVATNPDNAGESVLLAPGDVYLLMDFGYNDPAGNDIGDTIYFDANANGTQDAGESGIPGVTVALLDENGDVIATTTTDENGEYLFPGLPDEPYTVVVTDTDNVLGDLVNTGDPDGGNDEMSSVPSLPSDNLDQDFGYAPATQDPGEGLVGDTVFLDYNSNGVPDPGEGIEGVVVDLHDGTGAVIATTVTDENGNYYFGGLDPTATYSTTVDPTTLPAGIVQTVDPDGALDNTSTTDLSATPDGVDLTLDYGYEPTPGSAGSIGNLVWLDNNTDGVNDGPNGPDGIPGTDDDEPGIAGVTVDLYEDTNGNGVVDPGEPLVASTVTDANGNYLFPNLPTDNGAGVSYIVDVTDEANVLEGYWHSLGAPNTNDNSQTDPYAITLGGGNPVDNLTADFGYYVEPAVLGNYVWMDTNGDGIQDPGEMPIEGAVVTLDVTYPDGSTATLTTTTDATGHYIFENLLFDEDFDGMGTYAAPGVGGGDEPYYELSVETPVGKIPTIIDVNADGNDSEDSEDPAGTQGIAMQGFTDTMPQADPNDEPTHLTFDFGFTGRLGTIGNLVWIDENADGLQDAGEPGIPGVTVTATNPATGDVLTTVTDADGGYLFEDLPPGKYDILVDPTTLPSGMNQTTNPVLPGSDFGNQTQDGAGYSITIGPGEENLTGDFGYIWEDPNGNQGTAAIGDRVWLDADSDGVQDPGEAGIGGVTVTVFYDPDGDGIKDTPFTGAIDQNGNTGTGSTVTEPDGSYIFYNLPAGAYSIVVDGTSTPLTGLTQTGDPDDYAAPATNPDNTGESVVLAPGDVFLLMDFGYNDPAGNDIGDTIYFDPNANGTQDPGEEGIPGVTVTLLDQNGDPIATTTTDENGEYLFPGLPDEPYTVVVTDTDNVLGNLVNSGDPDGGNDEMSSVPGLPADNLDQDFGYTPPGQDPGEGLVGDTVFLDYNGDGLPDPGEGIEGVTVDLHDGAGNVIATTVTDENGNYYFPGLDPTATYSTTVDPTTLPDGLVQTVDPDGILDGTSSTDLSGTPDGIDLTLDYGYQPTPGSAGSIGNLVWLDQDADGVNDGPFGPDGVQGTDDDEPGIADVTIDLYEDTNGNGVVDPGEPLVASTVTDANGNYLFPNLPTDNGAGVSYVVDVTDENNVLEGYWHSLGAPNTNDNSQMDTYAITLGGGNPVNNLTADFGYYVEPAKLGNRVWLDVTNNNIVNEPLTKNGIQDPGEPGIANFPVNLEIRYPDGSVVNLTTTTDANGFYCFGNLLFDEDYTASGGPGQPVYTLTADDLPGLYVDPVSGEQYDLGPVPVNAGTTLDDSDNYFGTNAITCQGWTDVTMIPNDPNSENDTWASYDFGYAPTNTPVELVSFKGIEDDCRVVLTWVTATETNVSHFSVEQSANGTDFSTLGRVDATGESQTEQTYTFIDEQLTASNYYRLRIVDLDGSFEFSDIVSIDADCASGVSISDIFPNPVRNTLNIRVNSNVDHETARLVVTDNLGRAVLTQNAQIFFGANTVELNVDNLPQATYYITIEGENGWFTQPVPFVKVK